MRSVTNHDLRAAMTVLTAALAPRAALTLLAAALLTATLAPHPTAFAQGYPPAALPMPPAAIAESLAVLRAMDSAVARNQRDAAAWYRRGMVAWLLAEQARQGVELPGVPRLGMLLAADTSLRLAFSYDRENPRYMLTMGQFRLGRARVSLQRLQAYRLFEHALDRGRKGDDRALHAEAAIELGRVYWRRYDTFVNRRLETESGAPMLRSIAAATQSRRSSLLLPLSTARRLIDENSQPLPSDGSGEADYARAEALFREAYGATPDDPRTYRQLAMLLATNDRWPELEALSRERVALRTGDPWGWMTLGLALRRQGELTPAESAFAGGLARFGAADSARLDRVERVMEPREAARLSALPPDERERAIRTFWLFADPLWSRDGSDAHTEFLARVTFAELRWTVEELGVRGIDSDRGQIHARFGPPQLKVQLSPLPYATMIDDPLAGVEFDPSRLPFAPQPLIPQDYADHEIDSEGGVTTIWAYDAGWVFVFFGAPTYATSYIPSAQRAMVEELIEENPARWTNAALVTVEPMPTVVTRFRHGADSASVVVAIDAPVTRIRNETATNTRVRGDFWLFGRDVPNAYRDSAWLSRDAHAWGLTVPAGTYAYRAEATSEAAMIAGKSGDWIVAASGGEGGFALRGFGMSDVLLGTGGEPQGAPRRWYDVEIAAIGGTIPVNGDVELLWENYDFGARDGSARYDVTVTVQREYALLVNRIRARIVSGAATLLGIDRVEGRVIIRFEREVAHAPVLLDHVVLSMDGVPAGDYRVAVDVRDRVSGRTASRVTHVFVRE